VTRDEILLAAAQLFGEKGFHGASMQQLATSVNLRKASLYHHISSKQELLADILDKALDVLIERVEGVVQMGLPPEEKFRSALVEYLEALAENPDLSAVLLLEHNSLEAKYRRQHIPRRDHFEGLWRTIIEEGVAAGDFDCPDPNLASKALLGMMNWLVTWFRKDGPQPVTEIAEAFADLALNGLEQREGNA
jgi:AcrR family transcriptional regulator